MTFYLQNQIQKLRPQFSEILQNRTKEERKNVAWSISAVTFRW